MQISDNIPFVIGNVLAKFRDLENPETISRASAAAILPEMRQRIHVNGLKTDGSPIGTYSNSYLKLRQSKYNRSSDSKVIASLTRQLENGYTLQATENGYTIGNTSPENDKKIEWLEEKYGTIWNLTEKERSDVMLVANEMAGKILKA
jgi:hypothetical protein